MELVLYVKNVFKVKLFGLKKLSTKIDRATVIKTAETKTKYEAIDIEEVEQPSYR